MLCAGLTAVGLFGGQAQAQCDTYGVAAASGVAFVPGVADIGNHCDDCTTPVTIPFAVSLYGTSYTTVNVGSNGFIDFTTAHAGGFYANGCLPNTAGFGPTLFPHWDDLRTDAAGSGIFTTTVGAAPTRTFVIEWRATYFTGGAALSFEVLLHEDTGTIEFVYGSIPGTGAGATVGAQFSGTGPSSQFECNTGGLPGNQALRLTCMSLAPAACCTPSGMCNMVLQTACTTPNSFFGGVCSPNPCPQPPANDDCANAIVISAVPFTGAVLATPSNDDLDVSCNSTANVATRNGVWYKYTTGADAGQLTLGETGPNDVVIAAFTGADCSSLTELACFDAEANDIVNVPANTPVWILVGMWSTTTVPTGTYNLTLNFTPISGGCCTGASCTLTTQSTCTGNWLGAATTCSPGPQYENTGLGLAVPDYPTGGPVTTVSNSITVPATDLTMLTTLEVRVGLTMTFGGDFYIRLQTPNNTIIDLFKRPGTAACAPGDLGDGSGITGTYVFSDSGATSLGAACVAAAGAVPSGTYKASTCPVADVAINPQIVGQPFAGTWTLLVSDEDEIITGTVNSFGIIANGGYSPCPGACCTGGSCTAVAQGACIGGGGTFTAGGSCMPDPCGAVQMGACCRGSTCQTDSAANCVGFANAYSGNNTVCNVFGVNNLSPCCLADYNHVGGVGVQDIFDFLAGYFSGDNKANINGGAVGVQDIFDYLAVYFAGC